MDMTGEYRIPAPRQRVWEALNDPEVLRQAIPGCEQLDKVSDTELTARVKAKVGPVSATFNGKVTLGDLNPPESYTISGEGSGGMAGFAKGGANVHLTDEGADTLLRYDAKADVGGKLAQIGSRPDPGHGQEDGRRLLRPLQPHRRRELRGIDGRGDIGDRACRCGGGRDGGCH